MSSQPTPNEPDYLPEPIRSQRGVLNYLASYEDLCLRFRNLAMAYRLEKQTNENKKEGRIANAVVGFMLIKRNEAKVYGNFALADEIRDYLTKHGVVITDKPKVVSWVMTGTRYHGAIGLPEPPAKQ